MKKFKVLSFVLLIIVVCLGVLIGLIYMGKIELRKVDCNCETNSNIVLSEEKLKEIKSSDFNIIEGHYTEYNSFNLLTNGKVVIDLDKEIEGVSGATHMEFLDNDLYILTAKGEVYKYYTGITKEPNLKAEKLDYSNIKRLVKLSTRKVNAGGCDYLVVVDDQDNYVRVQDFCV